LDLSTHSSKVVTTLHFGAPSNNKLLSFKLACLDDPEMNKRFDTAKGNKVKMEISKYMSDFFKQS
jgi:hypothetical protein